MPRNPAFCLGLVAILLSSPLFAGTHEALLSQYATAAQAAAPNFSGFSVTRGKTLYTYRFAGGKADTPACTSCHGMDPRRAGRTLAGKEIEAVAVSVSPKRYTDPAKVEKWFKRNCKEVLGRECTALEKGDWLSYMLSQ